MWTIGRSQRVEEKKYRPIVRKLRGIYIYNDFQTCMNIYMRQYQILSKFWQGKNIKTSVFRTYILITQNTEQVLRISELLSVIQNSYIYGNHGNFKMELTLPVHSCYQSLTFFRRL
jgi:hypothetical protein